jgi:CheY-like chemotaxis protein
MLMEPDISMPVMDGFEAARQIRRLEKEYRAGLGSIRSRIAYKSGRWTGLMRKVSIPEPKASF